ncbi:YidC/Oxa1 family membrane protein insertase [Lactobacillus helveticus]|uniref:YidC/Oxa1 family membrane protein insertase n=1 Tax=Lactobacillus helveticus TaxID=1587 RepID=UPI0014871401|nr:membrane protein insertase YidC [Lactobacillus helveticus]
MKLRKIRLKDILTKRNVKRLLAVLALITLAVVLTGCAAQGTNGHVAPVSHNSGNWWDRWIVYYMSAFILWLAKLMGNSYGWAIIVFTIIIRVILLPLNAISIRSTTKMQDIQPQINELRKKYPGRDTESRTLLQQETNKLYKEAGVNPYTGCLPVLIQLPVMYALYGAILRTPQLQTGRFLWMDLSKPDPYYIMPILAMVFTFLSTYISQLATPKSAQNEMTKVMTYGMAIMVGAMALNFQSAITLYWVISNLFQAVQTFILQNPIKFKKEQEAKAEAERERKRKIRKTYKRLGRKKR